jgi:hypothetical protein
MNKFLFVLIVLLFLLGIVDRFFWLTAGVTNVSSLGDGLKLAEILGMIMMLGNGTFRDTRVYKITVVFIFSYILGVVFKIMHLTGADELLLLSGLAIMILYFVHFIRKEKKKLLDFLKLISLWIFVSITPLSVWRLISIDLKEILSISGLVVFWITFVLFIVDGYKRKALF